jgi:hypothetical protein
VDAEPTIGSLPGQQSADTRTLADLISRGLDLG